MSGASAAVVGTTEGLTDPAARVPAGAPNALAPSALGADVAGSVDGVGGALEVAGSIDGVGGALVVAGSVDGVGGALEVVVIGFDAAVGSGDSRIAAMTNAAPMTRTSRTIVVRVLHNHRPVLGRGDGGTDAGLGMTLTPRAGDRLTCASPLALTLVGTARSRATPQGRET